MTGKMPYIVTVPVADVLELPAQTDMIMRRESQLLLGEIFNVEARAGDFLKGTCHHDGYPGFVHIDQLTPAKGRTTHFCDNPIGIIHSDASIKSRGVMTIPMMARLKLDKNSLKDGFLKVGELGWIPEEHVQPLKNLKHRIDYVEIALELLGTPYRYGGRSTLGMDCSGLVQTVLNMSGFKNIPRDADMQERSSRLGKKVDPATAQRGDIIFFPQHVGIMLGPDKVISATEKFAGIVIETLQGLAERQGGITAMRRPALQP